MRKEERKYIREALAKEYQTVYANNEALKERIKTLEVALAEKNEDFYFQVTFQFRGQLCACPPRKKMMEAEEDERKAIALLERYNEDNASYYAKVNLIRRMEL